MALISLCKQYISLFSFTIGKDIESQDCLDCPLFAHRTTSLYATMYSRCLRMFKALSSVCMCLHFTGASPTGTLLWIDRRRNENSFFWHWWVLYVLRVCIKVWTYAITHTYTNTHSHTRTHTHWILKLPLAYPWYSALVVNNSCEID